MGYDKLISFISKNLTFKSYEEIIPVKDIEGYLTSKYIYYDINFIIYKCINDVENDINMIIKTLCSTDYIENDLISKKLSDLFDTLNLNSIISVDEIIKINNIDRKIKYFKSIINKVINIILYDKVLKFILFTLNSINNPYFIKHVNIFFDGIPSYSKMLEQRKRRIYNYLNSVNKKKIYNEYFSENETYIIEDENLIYDYFYYIKNTYNVNKNFGPESQFLYDLSEYLKNKLSNLKNTIITINNGLNKGEADMKIISDIENKKLKGEICIYSCDSDFLYFSILYELKNFNKYVNIDYIKYNFNSFYHYNINNIINLFIVKYKEINNINTEIINNNFLLDILFIIQFFGNDYLPEHFEISGDVNLNIYFKTHYENYKNNRFIININNYKSINYDNLLFFFENLSKYNLFTYNILIKNFKIPFKVINILVIDLKLNINEIISKILIPIKNDNINKIISELKINEKNKQELVSFFSTIVNNNNYGLIKIQNMFEYCDINIQNIYKFIVCEANNNTNKIINKKFNHKKLFNSYKEYLKYTKDINLENYFKVIEYQTKYLFYDIKYFNNDIHIYYKHDFAPSLFQMINFLKYNNINKYEYHIGNKFNNFTHNLLITPYLLDNNKYINEYKFKFTRHILQLMNKAIDNLFDINNINLRNIEPEYYLHFINNYINFFKSHIINEIYKKYNNLIKYNDCPKTK